MQTMIRKYFNFYSNLRKEIKKFKKRKKEKKNLIEQNVN